MALGKQNVRTAYPMDNVIRIFFESRGEVKQILWVPVTLGALGTLRRPCLRSRPLAEEVSADEVPRRTRKKNLRYPGYETDGKIHNSLTRAPLF